MILEFIYQIMNYLLVIIDKLGYMGIFIGMTIESSFFPFPSEVILFPAGALIANGEMLFLPVFIASLLGVIAGATINFFIAFFIGRTTVDFLISKYGKLIFITNKKLEKIDNYFKKHGEITTFVGRFLPGIRQLISLPAGFSKMNYFKFAIFTALGAGIWNLILIYVGYFFGNNPTWINENIGILISLVLIFSLLIIAIYTIYKKEKSTQH